MSSSQRPGKEVATLSQRKRVRSGGNVPPAPGPSPAVPRDQTRRFGVNVVVKEGKVWWKKHTRARYFSDVCIDRDSLAREFPQMLRLIRKLHMEFIYAELGECNLHMVREFYANWAPNARSQFVTVRGVNVPITPAGINDILGTPQDTDPLVLTGLNIRPSYRVIRHTLCGPQSMVKWTKNSKKRYHQSLPYAHMLREARVYALMTATELNVKVVLKSAMRKAQGHKGHRYAFGGLITRMCRVAGVPEENVDYMAPLFPAPVDITRTKWTDTEFGPILTTADRHRRDELIMARMYGLEMLRHLNGCLASTYMQLGDVERRYMLNAHDKALLGIGLVFREQVDDDIPTDEDSLRTSSDVESNSDEKVDPAQAGDEVKGGDVMED
uniref:Putative plant transposon protein domain-containing protein n=1 Tax=Solanum tuberosum TaxID=4113 RepID=M1DH54_SOLTU